MSWDGVRPRLVISGLGRCAGDRTAGAAGRAGHADLPAAARGRIISAMVSRVHSAILQGTAAIGSEVEADAAIGGMAEPKVVGLAGATVKGFVSRIRAALCNSGDRWSALKVPGACAARGIRGMGQLGQMPEGGRAAL